MTPTYQVLVYAAAPNGQPGTLLYPSPTRPRPTVVGNGSIADPVVVPGVAVNGPFFVALSAISGANNTGLAFQAESPLRAGTFFLSRDGGTGWSDFKAVPLEVRAGIEVTLGTATVTATRSGTLAAAVSLYPNPAHRSFRLSVTDASFHAATVTLLNALGQMVQSSLVSLSAAGDSVASST